jgi:small subunit ribosomal protein S14
MAKTSMIVKTQRRREAVQHRRALGLAPKPGQAVKMYNRCGQCGRSHGYMRDFDLCRICFRMLARKGGIMGIVKSSW